jgi:hypothetical protein
MEIRRKPLIAGPASLRAVHYAALFSIMLFEAFIDTLEPIDHLLTGGNETTLHIVHLEFHIFLVLFATLIKDHLHFKK